MLETHAKVTLIEKHTIYVTPLNNQSCQHCQGQGCSSYSIARLFCKQDQAYQVDNPEQLPLQLGQIVTLSLPEGTLLKTAFFAYLLPLLFLILGTFLGKIFFHSEGGALFGAMIGLCLGLGNFWRVGRKKSMIARPKVIKK